MHARHPRLLIATSALGAHLLASAPGHTINTRTLVTTLGESANDRLGAVAGAGDVDGDGFADVLVGAFFNDAGGNDAGRVYLFLGDRMMDDAVDLVLTGVAGEHFGFGLDGAGDVNGDGYDDLVVGGGTNSTVSPEAGRAYVYHGGPGRDAVADLTLDGEATGDQFGFSVAGAGDMNGDGFDDVIVGAPFNDAAGSFAGRAYVFFGGPGADAVPDVTLDGENPLDTFGVSVSGAGDVNGDGFDDVIVGAELNDTGGTNAGRAYVYLGGLAPDAIADMFITGETAGDLLGRSVSGAGDVTGDGLADVIVGARVNDAGGTDAGRAYVHAFGPGGGVLDLTLTGQNAGDLLGWAVSAAGDVNGDGHADVLVSADRNDGAGADAGQAYVYFGGPDRDAVPDVHLYGENLDDRFGHTLANAGDVTGDGFDDVLVGTDINDEAGNDAGKAYVIDAFRYELTEPIGGDTWPVGSMQVVRWLGADLADVSLSTDGGLSFDPLRVAVGGEAENTLPVRVPHTPTRFALLKVSPTDPSIVGEDRSDSLFTIETNVELLTFRATARPGGGAELDWSTDPVVGPHGIAGYRLYRSAPGLPPGDPGQQIGPALITGRRYTDPSGARGSSYRLTAINGLGNELTLGRRVLARVAPLAAWPVPFRGGELNVSFATHGALDGGAADATVRLYDARGRRIRTLAAGVFSPGFHTTTWDGRDDAGRRVPGALYFLRLRTGGEERQLKLVVVP